MDNQNNVESTGNTEESLGEENLRDAVVGIRLFKVGSIDEKGLGQLKSQAESVKNLNEYLRDRYGDDAPKVAIITNGDIAQGGLDVLQETRVEIIPVDPSAARRRAQLGKVLVPGSASTGSFSYTDMLNALSGPRHEGKVTSLPNEHYAFVSGDFAKRPEELANQLVAMEKVRAAFETKVAGNICMIGAMSEGIHNPDTVINAIEGRGGITLDNASLVFPNNALSMVEQETHFSGIPDNALAGKVEVGGEQIPVGGNEDFLYGFEQMVRNGRAAVLVVNPYMKGQRVGEVKGVDSKYLRRQKVYELYAERTLRQAKARGIIPENVTFEDIIDRHLFFAQIGDSGKPEIVLTARQREKGVRSPLEVN